MTDEELNVLEDPEEWDYSDVENLSAAQEPGAIFVIKVSDNELAAIAASAKALGMTVSHFLRVAVLEKAHAVQNNNHPNLNSPQPVDTTISSRRRPRPLKKPA